MVLNSVENEVQRLMREGQAAAKRGDKVMARALLTQLLEHDPHNEKAWMWLSGSVSDLAEQQTCLENVLIINPNNAQARKGLEFISNKTGMLSPVLANMTSPAKSAGPADTPPPTNLIDPSFEGLEVFQAPYDGPSTFSGLPEVSYSEVMPGGGSNNEDMSPWSRESLEYTSPLSVADVPDPAPSQAHTPSAQAQAQLRPPADEFGLPPWEQPAGGIPPSASMIPNPGANDMYMGGPPTPAPPPDLDSAIPDWVKGVAAPTTQAMAPAIEEPAGVEPFSPFDTPPAPSQPQQASKLGLPAADAEALEDGIDAWLSKFATGAIALPITDKNLADSNQAPAEAHDTPAQQAQHDPFASMGTGMDIMGPYGAASLPSPDELPGGSTSGSQPWYLQGSADNSIPAPHDTPASEHGSQQDYQQSTSGQNNSQPLVMIPCPNCKERVPETSLACPSCRYNFFVHCPSCHELVDTTDARPGATDACQYCSAPVNRFELGQMYATSTKTLVVADPVEEKESWVGTSSLGPGRRTVNLAWIVDLLWLLAIALVIWALTQLPAWFNLTGLYN